MRKLLLLLLLLFSLHAEMVTFRGEGDTHLKYYYEYAPLNDLLDTPFDLNGTVWVKEFNHLKEGRVKSGFWIHFSIYNATPQRADLFLLSDRSLIYHIEAFVLHGSQLKAHYQESYHDPIRTSYLKGVTERIFPLHFEPNERLDIYLKVQSFHRINTFFKLYTYPELVTHIGEYNFLQGIFFGVMLIMIIYNLILYIMLRFKPYLYYVFYVSSFLLFEAIYLGYLPEYTEFSSLSLYLLLDFSIALYVVLITEFLKRTFRFKQYLFRLNRLISLIQGYILMLIGLVMLMLYLDSFIYAQYFSTLFYLGLPLLYFLVFYALFYLAYHKYHRMAYGYALLWVILGFIGLLQSLSNNNVLPIDGGYDYLFEFGMLIETVVFSLLLGYRMKEIEQARQSQELLLVKQGRYAQMGELINMIAHQWRQPLTKINGIVMNIDIDCHARNLDEKQLERHLDDIEKITRYLSQTMSDFMNFFKSNKKVECFCMMDLLNDLTKIMGMSMGKKIEMIFNVREDLYVMGYRSELLQVLLIIVNNSIDACLLNNVPSPKIEIKVQSDEKYVMIEVHDNGGGIPEEILERVFDPYFTTKHQAKGTGLGLYILKVIVEKNMFGEVKVKNNTEGGVSFFIRIAQLTFDNK